MSFVLRQFGMATINVMYIVMVMLKAKGNVFAVPSYAGANQVEVG